LNRTVHDLETVAHHVAVTLEQQEATLVQGQRSQRLMLAPGRTHKTAGGRRGVDSPVAHGDSKGRLEPGKGMGAAN
jgi:hypothetical protein